MAKKQTGKDADAGSIYAVPLDPAPDLSLPPEVATQLETRLRQHLYRWVWRQDKAGEARAELYRLVTWLLNADRHGLAEADRLDGDLDPFAEAPAD